MPITLSAGPLESLSLADARAIAQFIDHSIVLRADVTAQEVVRHCEEAVRYGFPAVFVNAANLALAASMLHGTGIKPGATVGFPLGAMLTCTKRAEAGDVMRLGAQEIDMVMNVGALKSGDRNRVQRDIEAVTEVAHAAGVIVKVILEVGLLTVEEKILACELSLAAAADFVKTSTGLHGGATVEDVALMRGVVGNRAGVKAAGGIRSASALAAMVEAGANRIGTSSGVQIMKEAGFGG